MYCHNIKFPSHRKCRSRSLTGFAMIFAIFLVVALEAVIAGSFFQMAAHQRSVQRTADRVPTLWAAEAVMDRILYEISAYIQTNSWHPNESQLNDIINRTSDWYTNSTTGFQHDPLYESALNDIDLTSVTAVPDGAPTAEGIADYTLTVSAVKNSTQVTSTITQKVQVSVGKLFDFAVFYNDDLEIAPGPSQTIQGPIFSRKNIYLMTDGGQQLTLKAPANLVTSRQPYVTQSHGKIYFHFKRAVAKSYLLQNAAYQTYAPAYYRNAPGGLELDASVNLGTVANPIYPPRFYYFRNEADFVSGNNIVALANADGSLLGNLTPPHPELIVGRQVYEITIDQSHAFSFLYTLVNGGRYGDSTLGDTKKVSVSSAISSDPAEFPSASPNWQAADPISSDPLQNPNWTFGNHPTFGSKVAQTAPDQFIPLGDPSGDPHILIEPLTALFPESSAGNSVGGTRAETADGPEIARLKFQSGPRSSENVDFLNIYCNSFDCSTLTRVSPDFSNLVTQGVIQQVSGKLPRYYDYRINRNLAPTINRKGVPVLKLDIGKLLNVRNNSDKGLLIYIHTYRMTEENKSHNYVAKAVRLVNGKRLPKKGLTVVTNGRLWIQGNYNTFSYDPKIITSIGGGANGNKTCAELGVSEDDPACHCTSRLQDWEAENCKVPSAAIFSDSFGVLSKEWEDIWKGTEGAKTDSLSDRRAGSDMMVNTALATGFLRSQLKEEQTCSSPLDASCELSPKLLVRFPCEGSTDETNSNCSYYRDPSSGIYYLNRNYLAAHGTSTNSYPDWWKSNPNARIPIFIDAAPYESYQTSSFTPSAEPEGKRALRGVYLTVLKPIPALALTSESDSCSAPGYQNCPTDCPNNPYCVISGEESTSYTCKPCPPENTGKVSTPYPYPPTIEYGWRYYYPLYDAKYSGGLENLINFQEDWSGRTFRFSGTLSAPWFAKELERPPDPSKPLPPIAYYGTDYYAAPIRIYDYNENLADNPPPSTPGVFSIKRKSWDESE